MCASGLIPSSSVLSIFHLPSLPFFFSTSSISVSLPLLFTFFFPLVLAHALKMAPCSPVRAPASDIDHQRLSSDSVIELDSDVVPASSKVEGHDDLIHQIAHSLSRLSKSDRPLNSSGDDINTFLDSTSDPELDPNSDQFKSRKWVNNMLQMTAQDTHRYPRRSAGVSFRNLNVYGHGTAADYQVNFANIWLKAAACLWGIFAPRKKVKIEILRDLVGIVHKGEMLVVLGRPGRYGNWKS